MTVAEDSTQLLQQKTIQQRLHKLISTTLITTLQSIAEKRGNKAAEQHRTKKKQKLPPRPKNAKRRNFPSRPST